MPFEEAEEGARTLGGGKKGNGETEKQKKQKNSRPFGLKPPHYSLFRFRFRPEFLFNGHPALCSFFPLLKSKSQVDIDVP